MEGGRNSFCANFSLLVSVAVYVLFFSLITCTPLIPLSSTHIFTLFFLFLFLLSSSLCTLFTYPLSSKLTCVLHSFFFLFSLFSVFTRISLYTVVTHYLLGFLLGRCVCTLLLPCVISVNIAFSLPGRLLHSTSNSPPATRFVLPVSQVPACFCLSGCTLCIGFKSSHVGFDFFLSLRDVDLI